jgi:hypothetical protein
VAGGQRPVIAAHPHRPVRIVAGAMSAIPQWPAIGARLERELGEPVRPAGLLTPGWPSRVTWAVSAPGLGGLVVKVRHGDRADEKTRWCAANLPVLGARGYPVPTIVWHGVLDGEPDGPDEGEWHVTVQDRLPGRPLTSLTPGLLAELLQLIGRQADASVPAGPRDFTSYIANVLFYDWDEFGLGSRALDLAVLALNCERAGDPAAADLLLRHAAAVAGAGGLRCLVSYRAIAELAHSVQEGGADAQEGAADAEARADDAARVAAAGTILDRLGAPTV